MITRQQVTTIITTALKGSYNELATNAAQEFATNLATALDALGLIQFCDISEDDETTGQADPALGQEHRKTDHDERRNRSADQ